MRKRIQRDARDGRGIEHLPDSTAVTVGQSTALFSVRSMSYVKDAENSWQSILQRDAYLEVDCTKIRTERELVRVGVTASDY